MNSLVTQAGLKLGPVVLETLVRHYFDRIKNKSQEHKGTQLRQDELLYDEAFSIIKAFLDTASYHTVEDVQANSEPAFANTRTPSPPWVRVTRIIVPMSCCDAAAQYLISALGGEDAACKIVGGTKWWQVRGIAGVDGQWVTARKDWQEAKRRYKMHQKTKSTAPEPPVDPAADSAPYDENMDDMRCILYSHGGGYYFGSVDQERYSIQRHARKINGRVFAINYRLAPQYPFPCALQDLVAAYLYLIRPPPEAAHRPVNPAHIVVAGDSAGGGLTIGLLQILRDTGLPLPAGGILISPWCDLTHSFPSIHTNTATDVMPQYGLSFQKPSSLWPPPSEDMSRVVHASLRSWVRDTLNHHGPATSTAIASSPDESQSPMPVDTGTTTPIPRDSEIITLTAKSGEMLRIDKQIHMYTQNSLLAHPLISPVLSYLGGLPPLFIIASDKEVLRDEIIHAAHKAANPEKYPLKDEIRAMYPPLEGIEAKFGPTRVHLQVYDDAAHVLPVLFSFTTPGKFCYRAIAAFCRHVTGMKHTPHAHIRVRNPPQDKFDLSQLPPLPPSPLPPPPLSPAPAARDNAQKENGPAKESGMRRARSAMSSKRLMSLVRTSTLPPVPSGPTSPRLNGDQTPAPTFLVEGLPLHDSPGSSDRSGSYFSYRGSSNIAIAASASNPAVGGPTRDDSTSSDVAGPRFPHTSASTPHSLDGDRTAGDPVVYDGEWAQEGGMIRERVSTRGVLRPLEPEAELDAFTVPPDVIGVVSELAVRRFIEGSQLFDRKFAGTTKTVEKHRRRNLERAQKDSVRNMREGKSGSDKDGLLASTGSWSWAWALDTNETPPPSSIVSRRDTQEARRLARFAEQPMLQQEHSMTGNNLWSVMINFLTANPDKDKEKTVKSEASSDEKPERPSLKRKTTLSRIFLGKDKEVA
ncbi:alpha beta-hydrolase [Mycena rebaudengoi]|nr:alpha beta-hydrolase [Mycena rebaudengoi]